MIRWKTFGLFWSLSLSAWELVSSHLFSVFVLSEEFIQIKSSVGKKKCYFAAGRTSCFLCVALEKFKFLQSYVQTEKLFGLKKNLKIKYNFLYVQLMFNAFSPRRFRTSVDALCCFIHQRIFMSKNFFREDRERKWCSFRATRVCCFHLKIISVLSNIFDLPLKPCWFSKGVKNK